MRFTYTQKSLLISWVWSIRYIILVVHPKKITGEGSWIYMYIYDLVIFGHGTMGSFCIFVKGLLIMQEMFQTGDD